MKLGIRKAKKARIEILPLIDIVFLLLVFFIYAMLSMAVHNSLPVALPVSSSASLDKNISVAVTVRENGSVYVGKKEMALEELSGFLYKKNTEDPGTDVMLFADRTLSYQKLFRVLDHIKKAGIHRISLQAEVEQRQ